MDFVQKFIPGDENTIELAKSPVIVLPANAQWQDQLRQKLELYRHELDKNRRDKHHVQTEHDLSLVYKFHLLQQLLERGKVYTFEFNIWVYHELGVTYNSQVINDACAVIDRYTKDRHYLISRLPPPSEQAL